jgi:hypothetical protein
LGTWKIGGVRKDLEKKEDVLCLKKKKISYTYELKCKEITEIERKIFNDKWVYINEIFHSRKYCYNKITKLNKRGNIRTSITQY